MLPWVQWHRDRLADDGDPFADQYLNCTNCQTLCDSGTRKMWHCGWLPATAWCGIGFRLPVGAPEPTMCPGYTISLPEVIEAGRAMLWRNHGQLQELYDVPITQALRDCVDILNFEIKRVERHELMVIKQRQKREAQKYGHQ